MKIAMLSTPWIAVPPYGYGGIERVVATLTETLVKNGHEVMLFATGDSRTSAHLEYVYPTALGNDLLIKKDPFHSITHIYGFLKAIKKERFDIIHNHMALMPLFFFDLFDTPYITTLHGAYYKDRKTHISNPQTKYEVLARFQNSPYVSISDSQRIGLPEMNFIKSIYNGIDLSDFSLGSGSGGYLAWLGRVVPYKGLDVAIRVAKKVGLPIKIAAYIDEGDREYYENVIKPLLDDTTEFVGTIHNSAEKNKFLGEAVATLFPISWHEPFGIVMIESMAAGTPIIAFNKGATGEVIENGKTGFIVENEEQMRSAVDKISTIDRKYCRAHVAGHFTIEKMTDDYLEAYNKVISS